MVGLYLIFVVVVYLMGKSAELVTWINSFLEMDLSGGLLFFLGLFFAILINLLFVN